MLFKEKLKELRKERGISQYDLAKDLNISRSVIAKLETGLTFPNDETINLLINYFDVSYQELIDNQETVKIIVNKNLSITKMKKIIISLSITLSILISITTVILISYLPKSFSKEIDKLGNLNYIKIALYDNNYGEKYYLSPVENDIKDKAINLLKNFDYKFYPKNMMVEPAWLGSYSIILEGDIVIHINEAFLIIDGENRAVLEYTPNVINRVIDLLIGSDSIEVFDEDFYK